MFSNKVDGKKKQPMVGEHRGLKGVDGGIENGCWLKGSYACRMGKLEQAQHLTTECGLHGLLFYKGSLEVDLPLPITWKGFLSALLISHDDCMHLLCNDY